MKIQNDSTEPNLFRKIYKRSFFATYCIFECRISDIRLKEETNVRNVFMSVILIEVFFLAHILTKTHTELINKIQIEK